MVEMIHCRQVGGGFKMEADNSYPFPAEILHESPVSEDLLPPVFDWSNSLEWNPLELPLSSALGHDQLLGNPASLGRSCSDDMNVLGVELDSLMGEPGPNSITSLEGRPTLRPSFNPPAAAVTDDFFPAPAAISRLNPRVINLTVQSRMAMACHDYTNKLSYTLTPVSAKPACQAGAQKPDKSAKPVVSKKSYKSRTGASSSSGRKAKTNEDPDYLAHGTGIPR
jgi:hypothetical protein